MTCDVIVRGRQINGTTIIITNIVMIDRYTFVDETPPGGVLINQCVCPIRQTVNGRFGLGRFGPLYWWLHVGLGYSAKYLKTYVLLELLETLLYTSYDFAFNNSNIVPLSCQ